MSEENFVNKALTPKNMLSVSYTLNNFTKQQNTACTNMNNHTNKTYSTLLNMEENFGINDSKQEIKKKNCFVLKKINLKESKNNYYSTALDNMLFDPAHFLNDTYQGNKVMFGKNHYFFHEMITNKELSDSFYPRQKKKRKTLNYNNSSNNTLLVNKKMILKTKSVKSSRIKDLDKFNSSESSRSYRPLGEQRTFSVSDNELKIIYKEVKDREINNKKTKIDYLFNQTGELGINQMLDLQEKILKKNNQKPKIRKKLLDKIMNRTFKEKNNILMNQLKEFLILKRKKIDKELTKFCVINNTSSLVNRNWIYNLRKNIMTKNEERKCISPPQKEIIYSNKDFFPNETNCNFKKIFYNKIPKIKINDNNEARKSRIFNETNLNSFRSLYIQGKNLLNQEIKLSKDLAGKKKKLIQYTFIPKEISSMLLAKSKSKDSVTTPRAIINSMKIHNLK